MARGFGQIGATNYVRSEEYRGFECERATCTFRAEWRDQAEWLSGALLLTGADHADQDHHWTFIRVDNAADVWVSDVTAAHFAMSAVSLASGAKRATVQDCTSVE